MYAGVSNVARDIFTIIPHAVGVEASVSLGQDVIGWRQWNTTSETLRKKVVVRKFTQANNGILVGVDPMLDAAHTANTSEMNREVEERNLSRMAKVHNIVVMWQGSKNIRATWKESRVQNKQMIAIECIVDTEEKVKAFWSLVQHDGAAAFKSSERSRLPPTLCPMDLPQGRTHELNVPWIGRIDCDPVEIDEASATAIFSDTKNWLYWNGNLENPKDSHDDCTADIESDIERDNCIDVREFPEQQEMSAAQNVPAFESATQRSMRQAETVLVTVNALETRRNMRMTNK